MARIDLIKEEKFVLKNLIKNGYNYIVRDWIDNLYVYEKKPEKDKFGSWYNIDSNAKLCYLAFPHLFKFISWKNDEPYSIEELLKEGN